MSSVISTIKHRIVLPGDAGFITASTTVALAAPNSAAQRRSVKRRRVQARSVKRRKVASQRVGHQIAKVPQIAVQVPHPVKDNYSSANCHWPDWADPLDFQEVPQEKTVARVNAAGYFMHTLTGASTKWIPGAWSRRSNQAALTTFLLVALHVTRMAG